MRFVRSKWCCWTEFWSVQIVLVCWFRFLLPHQDGSLFVSMYMRVSDKKAVGSAMLKKELLNQFNVSEWLSKHRPDLAEVSKLVEFAVWSVAENGNDSALAFVHQNTAGVIARHELPHMLVPTLAAMIEHEPQLRFETWQTVLMEGSIFADIKDPSVISSLAAMIKEFLWRRCVFLLLFFEMDVL
jgi:hypothetical protein